MERNKSKVKDLAFWVMIIFIFGLGIYLIDYVNSESYACMNNPYVYGINLLEKSNDASVYFDVHVNKPNVPNIILDKTGFHKIETQFESGKVDIVIPNFNFTGG